MAEDEYPSPSRHPRDDDRNEELPQSPVPDPEAKQTEPGDDPEAD